ncbi:hypothetical protein LCGC14_0814680 [marine sediment metagenome]|uniref:Uncharacterized protein n=1 Tax=marine sediment metagenome TaxID=412755 RepID=A0A0F9Q5Y8_9ZZZZ
MTRNLYHNLAQLGEPLNRFHEEMGAIKGLSSQIVGLVEAVAKFKGLLSVETLECLTKDFRARTSDLKEHVKVADAIINLGPKRKNK